MDWEIALALLLQNINVGNHIYETIQYRFILNTPDEEVDYFKVSIGLSTTVKVTLEMFENIFNSTIQHNGLYNRAVIVALYPQ
jgi:hypothetical protein